MKILFEHLSKQSLNPGTEIFRPLGACGPYLLVSGPTGGRPTPLDCAGCRSSSTATSRCCVARHDRWQPELYKLRPRGLCFTHTPLFSLTPSHTLLQNFALGFSLEFCSSLISRTSLSHSFAARKSTSFGKQLSGRSIHFNSLT